MVRAPSFDRYGLRKGAWSEEEDNILRAYVSQCDRPNWQKLPILAGLARCGKSCRLRWVNYLKPGVRRGNFSKEEEGLIIKLHALLGNKWSTIAKKFPGRTDNDIKNYWNAHIKKRSRRSRGVTSVTSATDQVGQEEQSSEPISYITTEHYHEETAFSNVFALDLCAENPENIYDVSPTGDAYLDEQFIGHVLSEVYHEESQGSIDLPPFPGEELNDMSTFSDSSNGGITDSWNSTTAESQESFWSGQFGEMKLWVFDDNMNVLWQ